MTFISPKTGKILAVNEQQQAELNAKVEAVLTNETIVKARLGKGSVKKMSTAQLWKLSQTTVREIRLCFARTDY